MSPTTLIRPLVLLVLLVPSATAAPQSHLSDLDSAAAWTEISDDSLAAVISTQGYQVELRAGGLDLTAIALDEDPQPEGWRLHASTLSFGREGDARPLPERTPQASAGRAERELDGATGLVEWFVHDAHGLEQGWTIQNAPGEPGDERPLWIGLSFDGLVPALREDGRSLVLLDHEGSAQLEYVGLLAWDATGAELEAELDLTSDGYGIRVHDAGATFPVTVDPTYVTPPLQLDGTTSDDEFGYSVDNSGDVNGDGYDDLVVGSPRGPSTAQLSVYHGSANGLDTAPAIQLGVGGIPTSFGESVAFAGDTNGDGYDDVLVGAPLWNNANPGEQGAVFLYLGSATGISSTPDWQAFGPASGDHLGASVASAGDVDGDGYDDIVVGLPGSDLHGADAGSVHVYFGSASGLIGAPSVVPSNPDLVPGMAFGSSVASAGDTNADGYDDIIAGAPEAGRAFLFRGSAAGLSAGYWTFQDGGSFEAFGASVSSAGDVNGDGRDDVLIGQPNWQNPATFDFDGRAVLSYGSSVPGTWTTGFVTLTGSLRSDFGASVSTAGDLTGDGFDEIVVGEPHAGGDVNRRGRLRVFEGSAADTPTLLWTSPFGTNSSDLGASVAGRGDTNGDGVNDLAAGAPFLPSTNPANTSAGQVRTWTAVAPPGVYPGTPDLDFVFRTGVNAVPTTAGVKSIRGGDELSLRVETPGGALVGGIAIVYFQGHATGFPPGGTNLAFVPPAWVPWVEDLQLDAFLPLGTFWPAGVIDADGTEVSFEFPHFYDPDISLMLQAAIIHPSVPSGLIAWSDAHELRITETQRVHVSVSLGDAANPGTAEAPVNTLDAAIQRAIAIEAQEGIYPEIWVSAEVYSGITGDYDLPITMQGGCDPVTWEVHPVAKTVIIANHRGTRFRDIQEKTTISNVRFVSLDAPAATDLFNAEASIAVDVRDCGLALEFVQCTFTANDGGAGRTPNEVLPFASDGADGTKGKDWDSPNQEGWGGSGGDGAVPGVGKGGRGGDGYLEFVGEDGGNGNCGSTPTTPAGNGGDAFLLEDAGNGSDGADGSPGANGVVSPEHGGVVDALGNWSAGAPGTRGSDGENGCGGGGGGGGGGFLFNRGGGGGGGGGGGEGGAGGLSGGNGGGSFALYLVDSNITLGPGCVLQAGQGGSGGGGGLGRDGGNFGFGGSPGAGEPDSPAQDGGHGGDGGRGGKGGFGVSGHGGPSFCVAYVGPAGYQGSPQFQTGLGGNKGAAPNASVSGSTGPSGISTVY